MTKFMKNLKNIRLHFDYSTRLGSFPLDWQVHIKVKNRANIDNIIRVNILIGSIKMATIYISKRDQFFLSYLT